MTSRLTTIIEACREAGLDLSVYELNDVVYLAGHHVTAPHLRPPGRPAAPSAEVPPATTPDEVGKSPPDTTGTTVDTPDWAGPSVPLRPYRHQGYDDRDAVPMRAPAAPVLSRRDFAKAFRFLKRMVPSPVDVELDAVATARQAADTGLWDPVLVSVNRRWFGLSVVVDEAASGPGWAPEIHELIRAFEEAGAFSRVQVWRFDSDAPPDGPLTVRGGGAGALAGRDSREIADPTGRHAVLLLSDCVGAGWGDGRVGSMINDWAGVDPVAIVHLLPQRLWSRCAADLVEVDWRAGRPTAAGRHSQCRRRMRDARAASVLPDTAPSSAPAGTFVPVLDLTPAALTDWARLVAGAAPEWRRGMAFDTSRRSPPDSDLPLESDDQESEDLTELRIARFRAVVSPEAFRLATLLSAVPLQPAVVRMVQRTVLGEKRSTYWAEVLLSGLVYRVAQTGAERMTYEFIDGAREQLLTHLTRRESIGLLQSASEFVSSRMGGTLDFLALLTDDDLDGATEVDRPLARVAVQVLRSLGGSYADKAQLINSKILRSRLTSSNVSNRSLGIELQAHESGDARDGELMATTNHPESSTAGSRSREQSRAVIWDVPQRTQHFTGRDDLLDSLRQDLIHNLNRAAVLVPRALFGLGGVGKTALANEYAHRYRNEYDVVWWIPAEDLADVRRSLVELSRALRLPENTDQSETIRTLLRALHEGYPKARWLLIYDNATSPGQIRDLLPMPKRHGHVLVTSRERSWGEHGALLEVGTFSRPESIALLRRRATYLTEDDADRLAELLGDLPLALHQAAAWHAETELPVAEYRRRYGEKLTLLAEVDLPHEYPRPVGAAFGVSYDQLQSRSPAAAQLLQLCSYFGPEPIYVEMLYRARNMTDLPGPLRRQLADRSTIARELRETGRYELIKFDQARGRFQLHRLVQSVLRSTLTDEQQQTAPRNAHDILALANPGNPDELTVADLIRHAQLSPHILPSGIVESTNDEARRVIIDQIRYRYVVGDYEGSRELAESTVARWESQHGERDILVLRARSYLGTTLRSLGHPSRSLRIDQDVLGTLREVVGEDDDLYLMTASGYAADLRALGRFQEALEFDRDLLARHRRVLRDDDPATLRTANNYAVDLRLMGEFAHALQLDTQSVQHWTDGYGSDHHETLFAVGNLVRDYYGLGLYGKALTIQIEAIATYESAVGGSHLGVLSARRFISVLLRKLGRYAEARKQAEATHAAHTARMPEHHEYTLTATMTLCNALRDEHRDLASLTRARDLGFEALALYERYFNEPPFIDVCRINLALILRRLGEVAAAARANELAMQRLERTLGERHPYFLCSASNLASDFAALGAYEAASDLSGRILALSRQEDVRGPDHPYTLGCSLNHALDLERVGRGAEAETLWRDTVARFDRILGADHPESIAARNKQRIDADIEPPPT
ncbi:MAG TPA: FxSxx-COOH system tetratricopeptide repeat protein [Actinoplanes sp.]|nr:FxSxx-COOH system tetratricopeptide repeat protein [Actinoplanes sp.]